jgi:ribosome modulation factor
VRSRAAPCLRRVIPFQSLITNQSPMRRREMSMQIVEDRPSALRCRYDQMRRTLWMERHASPWLRLQVFKRGYFVGQFGRAAKRCPIKSGVLRWHWMFGWRTGADARKSIKHNSLKGNANA